MSAWPLFDVVLTCGAVTLHPVGDDEVLAMAELLPDDYEEDPAAERLDGLDARADRRRLYCQSLWRHRGTWSPTSWCWDFTVLLDGRMVGMQSLEADDFPGLRTVDSSSWLIPPVRGRGLGVAMRTAVLGLAFDHLGALTAVSSARADNAASLGVSRSIGYRDNGISEVRQPSSPTGRCTLQHVRLAREDWLAGGLGARVTVGGLAGCAAWFG